MARPIKKGLDYFTIETTMLKQYHIQLLRRSFGAEGFLFYFALISDIYTNGFYVIADDIYLYHLSGELRIDESQLKKMVEFAVENRIFDPERYQKYQILTSVEVQKHYFSVRGKKIDNQTDTEISYLLISENCMNKTVSATKTRKKSAKSTQSREEKSRVKESIEKNNLVEVESNAHTPVIEMVREQTANTTILDLKPKKPVQSFQACSEKFRKEKILEEGWQLSIVQSAGIGDKILKQVPSALDEFDNHIIASCQSCDIYTIEEYGRRFLYWWRSLYFKTKTQRESEKYIKQKVSENPHKHSVSRVETAMRAAEEAKALFKQQNYRLI